MVEANDIIFRNNAYVAVFSHQGLKSFRAFGDSVSVFSEKSKGWGFVEVKYRVNHEDWNALETGFTRRSKLSNVQMFYTDSLIEMPLHMNRTYTLTDKGVNLRIVIVNDSKRDVELGDVDLPMQWTEVYQNYGSSDPDPVDVFTKQFIYRQSLSLNSSFITFSKPSGEGPFYLVMTGAGTPLEFFTYDRGYKAYIHSAASGPDVKGNWRLPHSSHIIVPGDSVVFTFNVVACHKYEQIRNALYDNGLLDVRVAPGYVVPQGLKARLSLRCKDKIRDIVAEYPKETSVIYAGKSPDGRVLYDVILSRLGENMLTVCYGKGQKSIIEMFSCEPIETLIKKRARFITTHQQHKAPGKWWDGLYSLWDMKYKKLRGPEDTDGFNGWRGYMLACDDPILCKAPYVAAKNAVYPDSSEIASLEYYISHFVWGKLQRTDKDEPYPYAVYGVPSWPIARDSKKLATVDGWTGDRMKAWRTYDYPHIGKLYWHMYQIASQVPLWCHYLNADEYLERAAKTFIAYFEVPYNITKEGEVYRWGIYNEWLIPDIIDELNRRGKSEEVEILKNNWEKKVHYFIYEDKYPFRSEYSFDRTAFESTYAIAKYALTHGWNKKDAFEFMRRQHYAGLSVRGWQEPKYYISGADVASPPQTHLLTYMAMMAGWSILDYGLNFSHNNDWIEQGYNSFLSTWALMNSGNAKSNYGFWFPGKENDGASGMAFNGAKSGWTWIRKFDNRGAWRYDGEIDLGYGASFHTARTVVSDDSVFGLHVYGGNMKIKRKMMTIEPLDGVRQQLSYVSRGLRWNFSLNRDGIKAGESIKMSRNGKYVDFIVENYAASAMSYYGPHHTDILFSIVCPKAIIVDGKKVPVVKVAGGWKASLPINNDTRVLLRY